MRAYNVALAGTPAIADALQSLLALFAMPAIPDEVLGRIAVPTTLVWGRDDAIVPVSVGTAAAARYGWPMPRTRQHRQRTGHRGSRGIRQGGDVVTAVGDTLPGVVLRADDPGYAEATRPWNGMVDKRPAVVVQPRSAAEVAAAVRYAPSGGCRFRCAAEATTSLARPWSTVA